MPEAMKQELEATASVEPWITDCGGIQPEPLLPKEACVKGQ